MLIGRLKDVVLTDDYVLWNNHARLVIGNHFAGQKIPLYTHKIEFPSIAFEEKMFEGKIALIEILPDGEKGETLTFLWDRGFILTTGNDERLLNRAEAEAWLDSLIANLKSTRSSP